MRRAMAAMLSSRVWSASTSGPKRQRCGSCSLKRRGEHKRPGMSTTGSGSAMLRELGPDEEARPGRKLDDHLLAGRVGFSPRCERPNLKPVRQRDMELLKIA